MKRDKYYGHVAEDYDRARAQSDRWKKEQQAVEQLVTHGPVLDIPVGTGRYFEIYQKKGLVVIGVDVSKDMLKLAAKKDPRVTLVQGDILDPPPLGHFHTAVCTRLLDWLTPEEMHKAIVVLRRLADELVVSIRLGKEEVRTNQTHDRDKFYRAVDGLFIERAITTEITELHGHELIFKLRRPYWEDVVKPFTYATGVGEPDIARLAQEWFGTDRQLEPPMLRRSNLSAGYWSTGDLKAVVEAMAQRNPAYITHDSPRHVTTHPVVLMRHKGETIVLDGRRRINSWHKPELHPVLLIE